jgi:hypothetical protein
MRKRRARGPAKGSRLVVLAAYRAVMVRGIRTVAPQRPTGQRNGQTAAAALMVMAGLGTIDNHVSRAV